MFFNFFMLNLFYLNLFFFFVCIWNYTIYSCLSHHSFHCYLFFQSSSWVFFFIFCHRVHIQIFVLLSVFLHSLVLASIVLCTLCLSVFLLFCFVVLLAGFVGHNYTARNLFSNPQFLFYLHSYFLCIIISSSCIITLPFFNSTIVL